MHKKLKTLQGSLAESENLITVFVQHVYDKTIVS